MIIRDIQFTVPFDRILLRLQYNVKKSELPDYVRCIIDEMMQEAYILADPRASIKDFTIDRSAHEVILHTPGSSAPGLSLRSASLADHVRQCYKASLFLCTIGSECGKKVKEFLDAREITKAAVLDAVASEAVEGVADAVNRLIEQNADAEGATTLSRFSAGYGDWHISEQSSIIDILEGERIGVTLNEASLMVPEKSVSACVGWKKEKKPIRKILGE